MPLKITIGKKVLVKARAMKYYGEGVGEIVGYESPYYKALLTPPHNVYCGPLGPHSFGILDLTLKELTQVEAEEWEEKWRYYTRIWGEPRGANTPVPAKINTTQDFSKLLAQLVANSVGTKENPVIIRRN